MEFAIEKNIPVPARKVEAAGSKYNFVLKMEVGDSFLIAPSEGDPTGEKRKNVVMGSVYRAAKLSNRKTGGSVKFTCRRVDNGYRVWRSQ